MTPGALRLVLPDHFQTLRPPGRVVRYSPRIPVRPGDLFCAYHTKGAKGAGGSEELSHQSATDLPVPVSSHEFSRRQSVTVSEKEPSRPPHKTMATTMPKSHSNCVCLVCQCITTQYGRMRCPARVTEDKSGLVTSHCAAKTPFTAAIQR